MSCKIPQNHITSLFGCIGIPYDYNIFLVPAKCLAQDFISLYFLGGDCIFLVDIPL